jgi:hypothetical protein
MEDLRSHKIKYVNKVESTSPTYNVGNSMKIKINKNNVVENDINLDKNLKFKVGMKIKHKEEGIVGEIKFIGQEKIAIVWEDNTRERMGLDEAQDSLDYVDVTQTLVAPLETEMNDKEEEDEEVNASVAVNKAIDVLSDVELSNENEEKTEDIDIEKVKMKRQIDKLNNELTGKKSNVMKEKIAKELVDMAVLKSIIDEDDRELEITKILSFDDNAFEEYKNSILDYQTGEGEVTSSVDTVPAETSMTEAEKALLKIKNNGGKGIIGDFSKELDTPVRTNQEARPVANTASLSSEKRTLASIRDDKYTFATKDCLPPSFEESFTEILSEHVNSIPQPRQKIAESVEKELPGFENIQGLKKPIRIANSNATSYPSNTNISDLIGSLDWTILPGRR